MRVIATVAGPLVQLSPRERQVLILLAQGNTNKAIAHRLGITVSTVKGRVAGMTAALALDNRVQLCAWAIAHPAAVVGGLAVDPALAPPFTVAA